MQDEIKKLSKNMMKVQEEMEFKIDED